MTIHEHTNTIHNWVRLLNSSDKSDRLQATIALGNWGSEARGAIHLLIDRLVDEQDPTLIEATTYSIREIGLEAKIISDRLLPLFVDHSAMIRRRALECVQSINSESQTLFIGIIGLMYDPEQFIYKRAADLLLSADLDVIRSLLRVENRTLHEWINTQPSRHGNRLLSIIAFACYGPHETSQLLEAFKDPDPIVRRIAAIAITWSSCLSLDIIQDLLKDDDTEVRRLLTCGLGRLGSDAVPTILRMINDQALDVRYEAIWLLGDLRSNTQLSISILIELLRNDPEPRIRYASVVALGKIRACDQECVLALIHALQDNDRDIQKEAANSLGEIGESAKSAIIPLIERLNHADDDIRNSSHLALQQLYSFVSPEDGAIADRLLAILMSGKGDLSRRYAIDGLLSIECYSKKVIDTLIDFVNDSDSYIRNRSVRALGDLSPFSLSGDVVVRSLIAALKDSDYSVRLTAIKSLQKQETNATLSIPALSKVLHDENQILRFHAALALTAIAPANPIPVQALIETLACPNPDNRRLAAEALGKLGASAVQSIPHLLRCLSDPIAHDAVAHALEVIKNECIRKGCDWQD